MLISTDCGYNEADSPSKFHNVPLSFKTVLTVVGTHFGSLMNYPMLSVQTVDQKNILKPSLLLLLALLREREK